jgi:hypothetical protein
MEMLNLRQLMSSYRLDFSEIGIDIHTKYQCFLHAWDHILYTQYSVVRKIAVRFNTFFCEVK